MNPRAQDAAPQEPQRGESRCAPGDRMRAVLSIGANLGAREETLRGVFRYFRGAPGCELVVCSRIFATAPWGETDQPEFRNAVAVISTRLGPQELLAECQALERRARRVRMRHWGPRTLDVDIVDIVDARGVELCSADPALTLPHPYAHERAFVLVPWLDADPRARLGGRPVADLLAELPEEEVRGVRPL